MNNYKDLRAVLDMADQKQGFDTFTFLANLSSFSYARPRLLRASTLLLEMW